MSSSPAYSSVASSFSFSQSAAEPTISAETGKEVQVPTFIEIGDVLQIDTRDGRVIKRV